MKAQKTYPKTTDCFHCGNSCSHTKIHFEEKVFCCNGCKSVYELLEKNGLCEYYSLNEKPSLEAIKIHDRNKFAFLDNETISHKLIQFQNESICNTIFYIPKIHCSSCLWILENLSKLNTGIVHSTVNFEKKEVFIQFSKSNTNLREVVETLDSVGYEPHLSLDDVSNKYTTTDKSVILKLVIAGFCFGNIMMISFADYLANQNEVEGKLKIYFQAISLILSIPVIVYAAQEFFITAWKGIKNKYINIDLPVSIAILITFGRSMYDIFILNEMGYLDSMSGIVFFMLIGRWFQSRTYSQLSFDRDYKSFFPIAVLKKNNNSWINLEVSDLKQDDIIKVKHNEIIPVDSILQKGEALIDYNFITGESLPVKVKTGDVIYAGGKQLNSSIELLVSKSVSQSYLTSLWNKYSKQKDESIKQDDYDIVGKYFTYIVLLVSFCSGVYWISQHNITYALNSITTTLIVACPCALLLTKNFTHGRILNILSKYKIYFRNASVLEKLAHINHIIFDKTGTLTYSNLNEIKYVGKELSDEEKSMISSLVLQSNHPLSKSLVQKIGINSVLQVENYKETEGSGIEAWLNEKHIKIGSKEFIGGEIQKNKKTKIIISINQKIIGEYTFHNTYREGLGNIISSLKKEYDLSVLTGDNDSEETNLIKHFGNHVSLKFNQSPLNKYEHICELQNKNKNVMMIGDGLNDSIAFRQSDVSISITESNNNFAPSSDIIIHSSSFQHIAQMIAISKWGKKIIYFVFGFSISYNIIGLIYSIKGILSPVIAAILMPLSTITIISITYYLTYFISKKVLTNDIKTKKI